LSLGLDLDPGVESALALITCSGGGIYDSLSTKLTE